MPTYKFVKAPPDYPGHVYSWRDRILEHHLVWWRATGEVVPAGYVLHHKNEDTFDNRFKNLELKEVGEHTRGHHVKGDPFTVVTCAWCKEEFARISRDVRSKKSQGQERFFCSSSHAAKYGHAYIPRKKEKAKHGTQGAYRKGCRCSKCKMGNTERHRKYRRSKGL